MSIISTVIPWRLQLTVLQQEHYEVRRFLSWVFAHFFERKLPQKKKLVWTRKVALLSLASTLFITACVSLLILWLGIWGVISGLLLATQPWVSFAIIQTALLPIERSKKGKIIASAAAKLAAMNDLVVVGIAGSYGKTSMKTLLAHLLRGWKKVLATPLSHNVPLGIAQVIDLELTDRYDFFVVEMGEFYRGDIKELCEMVRPRIGMVTGLNSQHAERLGTIDEAGATLFELADYLLPPGNPVFVNGQDENITSFLRSHGLEDKVLSYASASSALIAGDIRFTDEGTSFTLHADGETHEVSTPLLGKGQVTNILGALTVAVELGAPFGHLLTRLRSLPQIPHRLERKVWENGILLIDDAYNSNVDGFRQALDVLSNLPRTNKILVTPGIIELGDQTKPIHQELGRLANEVCSLVILVGSSERTEALAENIHAGKKRWINDIRELWAILPELCPDPKDSVVLLENDLPESAM